MIDIVAMSSTHALMNESTPQPMQEYPTRFFLFVLPEMKPIINRVGANEIE